MSGLRFNRSSIGFGGFRIGTGGYRNYDRQNFRGDAVDAVLDQEAREHNRDRTNTMTRDEMGDLIGSMGNTRGAVTVRENPDGTYVFLHGTRWTPPLALDPDAAALAYSSGRFNWEAQPPAADRARNGQGLGGSAINNVSTTAPQNQNDLIARAYAELNEGRNGNGIEKAYAADRFVATMARAFPTNETMANGPMTLRAGNHTLNIPAGPIDLESLTTTMANDTGIPTSTISAAVGRNVAMARNGNGVGTPQNPPSNNAAYNQAGSVARREAMGDELQTVFGARDNHYPQVGGMNYGMRGNDFRIILDIDPNMSQRDVGRIIDERLVPLRQRLGLTQADIGFGEDWGMLRPDSWRGQGQLIVTVKDGPRTEEVLRILRDNQQELRQALGTAPTAPAPQLANNQPQPPRYVPFDSDLPGLPDPAARFTGGGLGNRNAGALDTQSTNNQPQAPSTPQPPRYVPFSSELAGPPDPMAALTGGNLGRNGLGNLDGPPAPSPAPAPQIDWAARRAEGQQRVTANINGVEALVDRANGGDREAAAKLEGYIRAQNPQAAARFGAADGRISEQEETALLNLSQLPGALEAINGFRANGVTAPPPNEQPRAGDEPTGSRNLAANNAVSLDSGAALGG